MKKTLYQTKKNVRFAVKTTKELGDKIFAFNLASIPLLMILPILSSFTPTVLLFFVEQKITAKRLFIYTALLVLLEFILGIIGAQISKKVDKGNSKLEKRYDWLLLEKLITLDYETIENPSSKTILQKAKNSMNSVYRFLPDFIRVFIYLGGILGICSIISILNPFVVLALIGIQLLLLLVGLIEQKFENKGKYERAQTDRYLNNFSKYARDFKSAKDIRLYSMQQSLKTINLYYFNKKNKQYTEVYRRYWFSDVLNAFVSLILNLIVYCYLFYAVIKDGISVAEFSLYLTAVFSFDNWLNGLSSSIEGFSAANHGMSDLLEFLEISNVNVEEDALKRIDNSCGILVENLTYTYPGNAESTLKNISFTIQPKEKIAIVGQNGAGKTTLIKLLCGLYSSQIGSVKIYDESVCYNPLTNHWLFSVVFQDNIAFPGTISSNISMLAPESTDKEKVYECLDRVGLTAKVKNLKHKENTLLDKNLYKDATELSGGELQKLLLARALYKNSPIIIFDEPTSALDPISEKELYLKYNEFCNNKTAIYISHRLASTKFCDKIIFLEDGEIKEIGTHAELMKLDGKYATMFKVQSKYYIEDLKEEVKNFEN